MKKPTTLFWLCVIVGALLLPLARLSAASSELQDIRALMEKGSVGEAEERLRRLVATDPSPEAYLDLGSLLGKQKRYQQAWEHLEEGLKAFPGNTSLLNLSGLVLHRMGKNDQAAAAWRKVLQGKPDDAFAARWLAKVGPGAQGEGVKPAAAAAKGTGNAGQDSSASVPDGQPLPLEDQKRLAQRLFSELVETDVWDFPTFESVYRDVIRKCPDTVQAEIACWRLSNLLINGYDQPDFQAVVDVLETFVKRYPDSELIAEVKNRLLRSYEALGNFQKMAEMLGATIYHESVPDKEFVTYGLSYARALNNIGRAEDAKTVYRDIIKRAGNNFPFAVSIARRNLGE